MEKTRQRIILASTSPYRKSLLQRILAEFDVMAPQTDETPVPGESAQALSQRLAQAKAEAVATLEPEAIVIGSDQTLSLEDTVLGKPGSAEAALKQLQQLSANTVIFHTSVALVCHAANLLAVRHVPTTVRFRRLNRASLQSYIQREPALDCAGSFKSEGLGISLFEFMRSDDPSAIIGLPLIATCDLLRLAGLEIP